jgi:hypothetical protein
MVKQMDVVMEMLTVMYSVVGLAFCLVHTTETRTAA